MKRVLFVSVAVALLAAPAFAQDADLDPNQSAEFAPLSGGGNWVFGTCSRFVTRDLEGQTGNNGHLGIQYMASTDQYYGSARGLGAVPPHKVYMFDNDGVLVGDFNQIAATNTSAWGYRDMATDGTFLYGGWEGGIARHNDDGSGGTQIIFGGGPNGNYRALAYDPLGDGGAGSFWSATFTSSLVEVSMNGTLLTTWPNSGGWSLYGLEQDPCDPDILWGYSSPGNGDVVQIDKTTGQQTGQRYTPPATTAQGGLTGVPGGAFGSGNFWDLVNLGQGTPDAIHAVGIYCDAPPGCGDCDPADMNCDGVVDALDIEPFICLLFDPNCPPCSPCAGDVNGDGTVNAEDIEPFINILFP